MSLTNEQIKQIIDGAPDGATHWDGCYLKVDEINWFVFYASDNEWEIVSEDEFGVINSVHSLSDLAEIIALRERVTELEIEFEKLQRAADRAGLRMIKAGLVSEFEKLDSVLCSYPLKLPKESANERD